MTQYIYIYIWYPYIIYVYSHLSQIHTSKKMNGMLPLQMGCAVMYCMAILYQCIGQVGRSCVVRWPCIVRLMYCTWLYCTVSSYIYIYTHTYIHTWHILYIHFTSPIYRRQSAVICDSCPAAPRSQFGPIHMYLYVCIYTYICICIYDITYMT